MKHLMKMQIEVKFDKRIGAQGYIFKAKGKNGITLVPLRFVAESLQLKVEWIDESITIIIE